MYRSAAVAQFDDRPIQTLAVAVEQCHARAVVEHSLREGAAKPLGTAGDENGQTANVK